MRLVEALRAVNGRRANDVLNLIQSNADLSEIRLFLAESYSPDDQYSHDILLEEQASQNARPNVRRKIMSVEQLTDTPVYRVSARPWTAVTDDDELVSHLISKYFTWNHQTLNWINRELFIRDMRSSNLGSMFCSPLLVNAMLAQACVSFIFVITTLGILLISYAL